MKLRETFAPIAEVPSDLIRRLLQRVSEPLFFVGLHHPGDAENFRIACLSVNTLWTRKKPILRVRALIDSGAYTIIHKHGHYPESHSVENYARRLFTLYTGGIVSILAAVAQDYMCEPHIRAKTGLSTEQHQRLTVERYDALKVELERLFEGPIPFHLMPVLQGQTPEDYVRHIEMYGDRLTRGMWVGVGSVCKRQGNVKSITSVLLAIKTARPDLQLHGFGVKLTALADKLVRKLLRTADSMAWSYAAFKQGRGRDANDWREARCFCAKVAVADLV